MEFNGIFSLIPREELVSLQRYLQAEGISSAPLRLSDEGDFLATMLSHNRAELLKFIPFLDCEDVVLKMSARLYCWASPVQAEEHIYAGDALVCIERYTMEPNPIPELNTDTKWAAACAYSMFLFLHQHSTAVDEGLYLELHRIAGKFGIDYDLQVVQIGDRRLYVIGEPTV